jgi:HEAT repeat protein
VEALVKVLRTDRDTFVRRAAARSLGEIGDREAAPALIEAVGDREFFVAVTAYRALTAISGQDFGFQEGLSAAEIEQVIERAKAWWERVRSR